jgi:5-methylcytosine-specific restriction endonuclease McrA
VKVRTQYQIKKARESRQSPEKVAKRKRKEATRKRLAKVHGPLKRGLPLSDAIAFAVVQCSAAFFVARCEKVMKRNRWKWHEYGCTSQGGIWNLGHIIPLHEWDLTDPAQVAAANHWANLVPECARANDHKREVCGEVERALYAANLALAAKLARRKIRHS